MRIGVSELIIVLIVALLALGPDRLPRYARKLGAALAEFRKASEAAAREIRENVAEPLAEAQKPLRDAMEPLRETERAVRDNLQEARDSLTNVGKDAPRKAAAQAVETPQAAETLSASDAAQAAEQGTVKEGSA